MNKLLQQKKLFKALFWAWGLVIFILSSLPNIPKQEIDIWDEPFRLDYLEHFGVFAIWGGFFVIWKMKDIGNFSMKNHLWFMMGTILFAALDEIHQIWIPGRTFNPLDLIYNVLGLLMGYLVMPLLLKWFYKE